MAGSGSGSETQMRDTDLFQAALGLGTPWSVSGSRFDAVARRLDIEIAFAKGARFACPTCGAAGCPAYDTEQLTWRHLVPSAAALRAIGRYRRPHRPPELRAACSDSLPTSPPTSKHNISVHDQS